jgi:ribonuclease HI
MQLQSLEQKLIIFTDGASLGNPGPGGYGAVLVFPVLDEVVEVGGMKTQTTNNEMELTAVISALSYAANNVAPTEIYTDSSYVVNGITKWINGWKKNGWMTKDKNDVSHKVLWQQLDVLVKQREVEAPLSWSMLPGHAGIAGNERADTIATEFGKGNSPELFRGRLSEYPTDVLNFEVDEHRLAQKEMKKSSRNSGKAHSYLSLIDGDLQRHETWADTAARVKGKNAKYRKALSPEHEKKILTEWGVDFE